MSTGKKIEFKVSAELVGGNMSDIAKAKKSREVAVFAKEHDCSTEDAL